MRGFLIGLLIAALLGAGAAFWTADKSRQRLEAKADALQAAVLAEQQAGDTDRAAAAAADRVRITERVIVREAAHGQAEIAAALGSRALVSADVGRAWRDAVQRLRDGAPDAAGAGDDHPAAGPH